MARYQITDADNGILVILTDVADVLKKNLGYEQARIILLNIFLEASRRHYNTEAVSGWNPRWIMVITEVIDYLDRTEGKK
jgi:hypothetical protein